MVIKVLFTAFLCVASVSASGCCRSFKILQHFRRASILPMYEASSACDGVFDDQDQCCDNHLYSSEPLSKYDTSVNRCYPPYLDSKSTSQKCSCSKSTPPKLLPTPPRYFKRNYCHDPIIEELSLRPPCGQYSCGHYGEYGQFGQYGPCGPCGQFSPCGVPPPVFRPPPPRILPLTLPASCVC